MHIGLHLSNQLVAEALRQLIVQQGYPQVSVNGTVPAKGTTPDVLLVDIATLSTALLARYPEAKVLLVDNGIEHQKLCKALLSYRLHGILPVHTEPPLLVKALKVVSEGQVWLDNGSVKALLHGDTTASPEDPVSAREQDIIDGVCQGLDNKQIATGSSGSCTSPTDPS